MNSCLTEFSEELFKKGAIEEGRIEASIENARNFFINGAPYELVRKSIEALSDEQLQNIYDEVMAKKMNK